MLKATGLFRFRIKWGLDRWLDKPIGDSVLITAPSIDHAYMAAQRRPFPGATHFEVWSVAGEDDRMEVFKIRGEIATPRPAKKGQSHA